MKLKNPKDWVWNKSGVHLKAASWQIRANALKQPGWFFRDIVNAIKDRQMAYKFMKSHPTQELELAQESAKR